jgi:hypothetical protein
MQAGRAVEMTGGGKRGKPNPGFPPFPPPLEIALAIPTFPQPQRRVLSQKSTPRKETRRRIASLPPSGSFFNEKNAYLARVAKDNTVAIADRHWQLEKSRFRRSLAGCTVTIHRIWMGRCPSASARMWSADSQPTDSRARPRPSSAPKAVEKTVPWRPWKTTKRFPTVPTAPWKSRRAGIPTFPPLQPRRTSYEKRPANLHRQADEGPRV